MAVKPVPDNYPTICSLFAIKGSDRALEFYKKVFGAEERMKMKGPKGEVVHCELQFGSSVIMFGEPWESVAPPTPQGRLSIYVKDCDAVIKKALDAGATAKRPIENQFYGDRSGTILDPFGVEWTVATHVEDVSPEEMDRRMKQQM